VLGVLVGGLHAAAEEGQGATCTAYGGLKRAGPRGVVCCPRACGRCGGDGCQRAPGGARQCCAGAVAASSPPCTARSQSPCVLHARTPTAPRLHPKPQALSSC
jgi:hypothetical protein